MVVEIARADTCRFGDMVSRCSPGIGRIEELQGALQDFLFGRHPRLLGLNSFDLQLQFDVIADNDTAGLNQFGEGDVELLTVDLSIQ